MTESQKLSPEEILYERLREPFDLRYINWKINNYNSAKTKAQITFHIDARAVQHKLNQELGLGGWSFTYIPLMTEHAVQGKLELLIDDKKVVKEDAGYASNNFSGEWLKDAVSDCLKRCAVHIGLGHFLYALPMKWIDLESNAQKYLSKAQDQEISRWLEQNLKGMRTKSKADEKTKPTTPKTEESQKVEVTVTDAEPEVKAAVEMQKPIEPTPKELAIGQYKKDVAAAEDLEKLKKAKDDFKAKLKKNGIKINEEDAVELPKLYEDREIELKPTNWLADEMLKKIKDAKDNTSLNIANMYIQLHKNKLNPYMQDLVNQDYNNKKEKLSKKEGGAK